MHAPYIAYYTALQQVELDRSWGNGTLPCELRTVTPLLWESSQRQLPQLIPRTLKTFLTQNSSHGGGRLRTTKVTPKPIISPLHLLKVSGACVLASQSKPAKNTSSRGTSALANVNQDHGYRALPALQSCLRWLNLAVQVAYVLQRVQVAQADSDDEDDNPHHVVPLDGWHANSSKRPPRNTTRHETRGWWGTGYRSVSSKRCLHLFRRKRHPAALRPHLARIQIHAPWLGQAKPSVIYFLSST